MAYTAKNSMKGIGPLVIGMVFALGIAAALIASLLISRTYNTARILDDTSISRSADQLEYFKIFIESSMRFSVYQGFFNIGEGGGYRYSFAPDPKVGNNPRWYNNEKSYPSYEDDYIPSIKQSVSDFFDFYMNSLHETLQKPHVKKTLGNIEFVPDEFSITRVEPNSDDSMIEVEFEGGEIVYETNRLKLEYDESFGISVNVSDYKKRYDINKKYIDDYVASSTSSPNYEYPSNRLHEKVKKCVYGNADAIVVTAAGCGSGSCGGNPPNENDLETQDLQNFESCINNAIAETETLMNNDADSVAENYAVAITERIKNLDTEVSCTYQGCSSTGSCCATGPEERNTPNPINAWDYTDDAYHPCNTVESGWNRVDQYCRDQGYGYGAWPNNDDPCYFKYVSQRYHWDGTPVANNPPTSYPDGAGVTKVKCEKCTANTMTNTYNCHYTRSAELDLYVKSEKQDSDTTLKDQQFPVYSYEYGTTLFRTMYMKYLVYVKEPA